MNAEEFNSRIAELTVGTEPGNRRNLLIRVDDGHGTCFHVESAGGTWVLTVPVGGCRVCVGVGSCIEIRPSWKRNGAMELTIGSRVGDMTVVRGFVELPDDAGIEIEIEEGSE